MRRSPSFGAGWSRSRATRALAVCAPIVTITHSSHNGSSCASLTPRTPLPRSAGMSLPNMATSGDVAASSWYACRDAAAMLSAR